MLSKAGLKSGDVLVLTKPLGFGLTTTALKRDQAEPADLAEAVGWMTRLNRTASELALEFDLAAGTDITGFGLLGHGLEMAARPVWRSRSSFDKVPFLRVRRKYAAKAPSPAALLDNRNYFGPHVRIRSILR